MDYFDELEKNYFIYNDGRPCICQNKKGEFISSEFIEDTLNKMLKVRRKILKELDEYHTVAIIAIDSEIRQIKEIKEILLGGKKDDKKIK